jgi:hypothetical protein
LAPTDQLQQPGTEDPDAQSADEEPQPEYGPCNEQLPEQLVAAIRSAITEFQSHEKYSRRREVIHDRQNRFYARGYQHISWNNQTGTFSIMSPGGFCTSPNGQQVQAPDFIDDYDLFSGYLEINISVLTQNPPGVNFQPIDPNDPDDNDKKDAAENYAHAWDRMNDRPAIQAEIVRMMGLSGRTVSWTRDEEDGQRFGYNPDGSPRIFQRTTIHGTLETKVPITADALDKDFLYCLIYDDPDVKIAKRDYPHIKAKIKAGTAALGENNYERTARLGVLNGSRSQVQVGDSYTHLVSRLNAFLRPAAFEGEIFEAPFEEDGSMTVGEKLNELFPDGCRAVWIGDTYAESYAESMDDHLDIGFPFPGDGMFRKATMDPFVVEQDFINDTVNGLRGAVDTGWGAIWFNSEDEDLDAVRSQRAMANAIRGFKCKDGLNMQQSIYKEQGYEIPPSLSALLSLLMNQLPEFQLAAPPVIAGQGDADQKTASGINQLRAQAMGRQGLTWSAIQHMFARIRFQSALAASKCDAMQGEMTIPGKQGEQPITVNLDRLKKGNFGCYPDEDSSFPESTLQKRGTFQQVVTMAEQSPVVMQMLDNPDNIATAKRLWGLDELVLLPAESRNKQLAEIEILITQEPIGWVSPEMMPQAQAAWSQAAQVAAATMQPPPPPPNDPATLQPSVPIRPLDYHQWEGAKGQEWLSSRACREQEAKGNFAGVANVTAHTMAHLAAVPPPQPLPLPAAHSKAAPPVPPPQPTAPAPAAPVM